MCVKWCPHCRLLQKRQNPYFDSHWDIDLFDRLLIIPEDAKKDLINRIKSKLQLKDFKEIRLLFIGCGTGRLELPLLKSLLENSATIKQVHIVDVNKGFIEHLLSKISQMQELNQVEMYIHFTDIDTFLENHIDLKFHIITAFFVLYLSPQWHLTCKKIFSNLEKNGYLLLAQEIGDFAMQNKSDCINLSDKEKNSREKFLRLSSFIGEYYRSLYDLHSFVTLGILEVILRRFEAAKLIKLCYIEKCWKSSEVSFREYLSAMIGATLALAIGVEGPVKFRKAVWEKFKEDWSNDEEKCPRIEGHRVWIVQVKEPDKIMDLFLQSYYILLSQIENKL